MNYSKLNEALAEVNAILPAYWFDEWHQYSTERADRIGKKLYEIKTACENALKELNAVITDGEEHK